MELWATLVGLDRILSMVFSELKVSGFWGVEGSIAELVEKMGA